MVTNPPYGERLISDDLFNLYREMGAALKHRFTGNEAWVISSHIDCLAAIGLKPSKKIDLLNGALECEFWKYELFAGKRNDFAKERNERYR
jgi:putative N6-adenine-specific DNA methylase